MSYYDQVKEAADAIRSRVAEIPAIGIVLGSGLGDFAGSLGDAVTIPYGDLPHWPASRVIGHDGKLVVGMSGGRAIAALAGRVHLYEGHDARTAAFAVRVLGLLGVKTLILTNAAGGVNTDFSQGALMVIDDHINLMGGNPLVGDNDERFGPRFPDMTDVYSSRLRGIADRVGKAISLPLRHGIYVGLLGPSYETPAEIRFLRTIGAHAVGMSTVPEAIAARHMQLEVLGISCITNMAAGVLPAPLDHAEVMETARRIRGQFIALLEGVIGQIESRRLSVSLIDLGEGHDVEFDTISTHFEALLIRKEYGRAELIRDEGYPLRFYSVRYWVSAAAAEQCHRDPEVQMLTARLYQIARVTHVVNGVRRVDAVRRMLDERRARVEADRRTGFDRRIVDLGRAEGDRRAKAERRLGPRRVRDAAGEVDLIAAARRAREHADAAFSQFRVGAALETGDGSIITGCNIENATYGLTICAERVAMFKALSEGHRVFVRIAIVADTAAPTPPCGACRQILWEFGGNLEIQLANLDEEKGTHQLKDLLPLPFDARLLERRTL